MNFVDSKILFQNMFGEYLNVSLDQTRTMFNYALKKEWAKIKATGMGQFYLLNIEGKLLFHYISVILRTEQTL